MVAWRASKSTFQGLEMAQRCRPWLEENGCCVQDPLAFCGDLRQQQSTISLLLCALERILGPSEVAAQPEPPRSNQILFFSQLCQKEAAALEEQAKHSCSCSEEGRKPPGLQRF